MSARWLYNLTAVYLAVLYGVVGLTGDSIHYLTTNGWRGIVDRADGNCTVYYHVHEPDFHGHFHRHVHHHHHEHAISSTTHNDASGESLLGVVLKRSTSHHESHACPALALVSVLKLVHASRIPRINLDSVISPYREVTHTAVFEATLRLYPRGPPSVDFA